MNTEGDVVMNLRKEGYDRVYVWNAKPNEVDEAHSHDFDTRLIVLEGQIEITAPINGEVVTLSHSTGSDVEIVKHTSHSAKVGSNGCRYVVAERH